MNSLPQELVDRINSYLTMEELKQTLTLNKAFNIAAEQLSGVFCSIELTRDNSQKFVSIYSGPRFRLLREVVFHIYFTPISDEIGDDRSCRESQEMLQRKDELFTDDVRYLFSILHETEQRAGIFGPGRFKVTIYGPTRQIGSEVSRACLHRMYVSWRVYLLTPENLPELQSVRSLQLNQGELTTGHRYDTEVSKLDLRMIVDLANRLPNLDFIGCQLGQDEFCHKYAGRSRFWSHYEHDWEGPRRDTRHQFAEAAEASNLPLSLKRARLDFLDNYDQQLRRLDQQENMPDLTGSAKRDPFSAALCTLSHNLRILELRGIVDMGFFQSNENDDTLWPNLESLVVMFWPVSPSGTWYFHGPGGEGKQTAPYSVTKYHYPPLGPTTNDIVYDEFLEAHGRPDDDIIGGSGFRIVPNETVLVPFLTAFANAASRMPKLKDANLWTPLVWYRNEEGVSQEWLQYESLSNRCLAWGIAYDKSSAEIPRKLTWRVSTWRPDENLHSFFFELLDASNMVTSWKKTGLTNNRVTSWDQKIKYLRNEKQTNGSPSAKHRLKHLEDLLDDARDEICTRQLRHEQTAATMIASDLRRTNANFWEIQLLMIDESKMQRERDCLVAELAGLEQEAWRAKLESARTRASRAQGAKSKLRQQVEFD